MEISHFLSHHRPHPLVNLESHCYSDRFSSCSAGCQDEWPATGFTCRGVRGCSRRRSRRLPLKSTLNDKKCRMGREIYCVNRRWWTTHDTVGRNSMEPRVAVREAYSAEIEEASAALNGWLSFTAIEIMAIVVKSTPTACCVVLLVIILWLGRYWSLMIADKKEIGSLGENE